jgi:hypothetical protein
MIKFATFMGILFLLFFWMMILAIKFKQREKNDPIFFEKAEKWRYKWNPKIDFFENLVGWLFALFIFYYIYLG